jgi:hypothetical protein
MRGPDLEAILEGDADYGRFHALCLINGPLRSNQTILFVSQTRFTQFTEQRLPHFSSGNHGDNSECASNVTHASELQEDNHDS